MSKVMVTNLVLALAILLLLPTTYSVVPSLINYQGLLKDDVGEPQDGTFSMTFKIFTANSGGTELWSETHPAVSVNEGLFKVVLGSQGAGLPQTVFSGAQAWLEISVGGETIGPRIQFTSGAFSHRVSTVDGASSGVMSGDLTVNGKITATSAIEPLGGIIMPAGITIQSTAGNVVIVAGASTVTVSPSGGITIQGNSVGINATGTLTLSAANKVAINAPWVDMRGDSLTSVINQQTKMISGTSITNQAGTNFNVTASGQATVNSGSLTNITAGSTLDLNGNVVLIN